LSQTEALNQWKMGLNHQKAYSEKCHVEHASKRNEKATSSSRIATIMKNSDEGRLSGTWLVFIFGFLGVRSSAFERCDYGTHPGVAVQQNQGLPDRNNTGSSNSRFNMKYLSSHPIPAAPETVALLHGQHKQLRTWWSITYNNSLRHSQPPPMPS
jgi:hypothetical protein